MTATAIAQTRKTAEKLTHSMPALLIRAEQLRATLRLGVHGRRQAGRGEEFWQYRPAIAGDQLGQIDWRRSARSETVFVRETEMQSPQSVHFHIDQGQSMAFSSRNDGETKHHRAIVLGLAIASLLSKSGERFALLRDPAIAKTGSAQLNDFAAKLANPTKTDEFELPAIKTTATSGQIVMLSDFMSPWEQLEPRLQRIAHQRVDGVMLQILDHEELTFPYRGRINFQSMGGALNFHARSANHLRHDYLQRLAQCQTRLREFAQRFGWRFQSHDTSESAQSALLWLYQAMTR